MAYDLEEQEQLATLKAFWKQYGNLVTWLLIAGLSAYAAWMTWNNYQAKQSVQASQLYEELQKSLLAKDNTKVQRAAADIGDKFSRTSYAPMAALAAAKSAFDAGDLKTARTQLDWVVAHSDNGEYKSVAKIRLAGIALDEKNYDDALKQLSGEFPAEFFSQVSDRKGDIFVAQNKLAEARQAYQAALEKSNEKEPGRALIQLKLDAIGGTSVAKVAGK